MKMFWIIISALMCIWWTYHYGYQQGQKNNMVQIVDIAIKIPGQNGYAKQQAILDTFTVELMGRTWNAVPAWQPWLEPYIEAMADSGFDIKQGQIIEFKKVNP